MIVRACFVVASIVTNDLSVAPKDPFVPGVSYVFPAEPCTAPDYVEPAPVEPPPYSAEKCKLNPKERGCDKG